MVCARSSGRRARPNLNVCRSIKPLATVQAFDPLCEVQSDKASVEITSPFDGVVTEMLVKEGDIAKVGAPLCLIEVEEEVDETVAQEETPVITETTPVVSTPSAPPSGGASPARRRHPLDPENTSTPSTSSANVFAAPSVRHFARQNGVDLASLVPGSGKAGRIEKRDVEAALAPSLSVPSSQPSYHATPADLQEEVIVDLGRTRYGMWKAMVKVRRAAPIYRIFF